MPCRVSMAYGEGVGVLRSWAAMSWWQQGAASTRLGAPADRLREGLVGRGVAGVQGEHDLGRRVQDDPADGADHELARRRRARRPPSCCARATAP